MNTFFVNTKFVLVSKQRARREDVQPEKALLISGP